MACCHQGVCHLSVVGQYRRQCSLCAKNHHDMFVVKWHPCTSLNIDWKFTLRCLSPKWKHVVGEPPIGCFWFNCSIGTICGAPRGITHVILWRSLAGCVLKGWPTGTLSGSKWPTCRKPKCEVSISPSSACSQLQSLCVNEISTSLSSSKVASIFGKGGGCFRGPM